MSRIDDLIKEHCPNGVPYQELGKVIKLNFGTRITRLNDQGTLYPVYGGGGESFRTDSFNRENDYVVSRFAMSAQCVRKVSGKFWMLDSGFTFDPLDGTADKDYVAYVLFNTQPAIYACSSQGAQKNLKTEEFRKFRIPVPPIAIQREIVRILDLFTELEAELEAELEKRRQQYAHYHWLALETARTQGPEVLLEEVADVLVGFPFKSNAFSTTSTATSLVRGDNVGQGVLKQSEFKRWVRTPNDGLDTYELCIGDLVLAMDRPWIPAGLKWARIPETALPALLVQRVARLRANREVLDQRFLAAIISSPAFTEYIRRVTTGNTVPHISSKQIGAYMFHLPSLENQERIALAVGAFETLASDLSVGLPAEISARRKQYAYYRDRLLTFEEAPA